MAALFHQEAQREKLNGGYVDKKNPDTSFPLSLYLQIFFPHSFLPSPFPFFLPTCLSFCPIQYFNNINTKNHIDLIFKWEDGAITNCSLNVKHNFKHTHPPFYGWQVAKGELNKNRKLKENKNRQAVRAKTTQQVQKRHREGEEEGRQRRPSRTPTQAAGSLIK